MEACSGFKCPVAQSKISNSHPPPSHTHTLLFCREEVRLLKEELTEEYEADKQAALTQLSQQKELEMMAAREGWQRKVEDLLEQVKHIGTICCWYLLLLFLSAFPFFRRRHSESLFSILPSSLYLPL